MTLPPLCNAALLLFALAALIVVYIYLAAPIIHDAVHVEPVRPDAGEYGDE